MNWAKHWLAGAEAARGRLARALFGKMAAALLLFLLAAPFATQAQVINTVAGGGPNNIPALTAGFTGTAGVAADGQGNFYFTDFNHSLSTGGRVFKVDANGIVTVVAGNGMQGFSGDGGPAVDAEVSTPGGVAVDAAGNIFIADSGNSRIREVFGPNSTTGTPGSIVTVAGGGANPGTCSGNLGGNAIGDGCAATNAILRGPEGVFVDGAGNLFIADTSNSRVREVSASTKVISTVVGNGSTSANFTPCPNPAETGLGCDGGPATDAAIVPNGVFVDANGNMFISDQNGRIREVVQSSGKIFTVAGAGANPSSCAGNTGNSIGDGCAATNASLARPMGLSVDGSGNIFIVDSGNQRIREVVVGTPNSNGAVTGTITTFAGGGPFPPPSCSTDFLGDGCPVASARFSAPQGVFVDSSANVFITDLSLVRKVFGSNPPANQTTGTIAIAAGSPVGGSFSGDGFAAVGGQLNKPTNIFVDGTGNIFIADRSNGRIREVFGPNSTTGTPGNMITVAGGSSVDIFSSNPPPTAFCSTGTDNRGDGCPATSANLQSPSAVFVDGQGNILIADTGNNRIREVFAANSTAGTPGTIVTVAGNGTSGFTDNVPATSGQLTQPQGVFVDQAGNIFIADSGNNNRIREVLASSGMITTVAGTGGSTSTGDGGAANAASLNGPTSVVVDGSGNIFISEPNSGIVREIFGPTPPAGQVTGRITTVAGTGISNAFNGDDIPATTAQLSTPTGISVDGAGNLFIADMGNSRIREVFAANSTTGTPGNIVTVAGGFTAGFAGDGGAPTNAELNQPSGVFVDAAGDIFIADTNNQRVRVVGVPAISFTPNVLTFGSQSVGTTSPAQSITLKNSGEATLGIIGIAIAGADTGDFTQTNNCPETLTPGASCTVSVGFVPTASANRTASLTVTDNAVGTPQSVNLSGTGAVAPAASLNQTSLTFASQPTGTTSGAQTVTLSNTGSATLNISNIAITGTNPGDFAQTNTCGTTPATLAAGTNCTITVTFTPQAAAGRSASLTITDDAGNAPSSQQSTVLIGTGSNSPAPVVSFNPASVAFAGQPVGSTSTAQTITITNTGNAALTISNIALTGPNSGDFAITSNVCANAILGSTSSCVLSVVFKPSASGTRSALLTVTDSAADSPQSASLSGTGTVAPAASLSTASVTFASQPLNTTSGAQAVILTNSGNAPLTISAITFSGSNSTDFSQTNNCSTTAPLSPAGSCTINVTFTPAAVGTRLAVLNVADNAAGGAQSVILVGTGGAAPAPVVGVSPASLNFASQTVGTTSATQTVTLTNTGNAALTVSGVTLTGTNSADFTATNNCATSIVVNGSCTITVTFKPAAAGARSAFITITDNSAGSPHSISLSGTATAQDFALAPPQGGATTMTVTAGQTANYTLQLTATGAAQTVSLSCIGAPAQANCTVPATVTVNPGTPAAVNISVTTTARALLVPRAPQTTKPPFLWIVALSLAAFLLASLQASAAKRPWALVRFIPSFRMAVAFQLVLLLVSVASLTGCAGSAANPPKAALGTPAGSSTLVITATTSGASHFTELTLTVQ